ncbi:MAG: DUF188 domain-containing protein [Eubacteriales bacterium]
MLVDADGCPVTRIAVRVAAEYGVSCVVFCDMAHEFRELGSSVEVVTVSTGADSTDFALVNRAEHGDIVVTQDFGLAAMCMARGAVPVDQNGRIYSDDNIGLLLEQRNIAKRLRRGARALRDRSRAVILRMPRSSVHYARCYLPQYCELLFV